jgi:hypothetical protein
MDAARADATATFATDRPGHRWDEWLLGPGT